MATSTHQTLLRSTLTGNAVPQTSVVAHSLNDLLELRAQLDTGSAAYTFLKDGETGEESVSYKELDWQARAIAARMLEHARPGDRALLLFAPGLGFLPAFFGCLYAGIIAVPAYPPHRNRNLLRLMAVVRDAQPRLLLTTSALLEKISASMSDFIAQQEIQLIAIDGVAADYANAYKRVAVDSGSIAFLQYTSGSTGNPKGVMITHENLLHNAAAIYQAAGQGPADSYFSWLPVFHDMGFMAGILEPLYVGSRCIQMSPAAFLEKPLRWLNAISRSKLTTSGGPNFAFELCLNKISEEELAHLDLITWEVAFNGADPILAETIERFVRAYAACVSRCTVCMHCYG